MSDEPATERFCASCGRRMEPRRRWRANWAEVRHCSERCRRTRRSATGDALEAAILTLCAARPRGATICPSEAARLVGGEDHWRALMEPARAAARRLVVAGKLEVLQRNQVVDASTARGPIRLRLRAAVESR